MHADNMKQQHQQKAKSFHNITDKKSKTYNMNTTHAILTSVQLQAMTSETTIYIK
jgi:hypothetical protein